MSQTPDFNTNFNNNLSNSGCNLGGNVCDKRYLTSLYDVLKPEYDRLYNSPNKKEFNADIDNYNNKYKIFVTKTFGFDESGESFNKIEELKQTGGKRRNKKTKTNRRRANTKRRKTIRHRK